MGPSISYTSVLLATPEHLNGTQIMTATDIVLVAGLSPVSASGRSPYGRDSRGLLPPRPSAPTDATTTSEIAIGTNRYRGAFRVHVGQHACRACMYACRCLNLGRIRRYLQRNILFHVFNMITFSYVDQYRVQYDCSNVNHNMLYSIARLVQLVDRNILTGMARICYRCMIIVLQGYVLKIVFVQIVFRVLCRMKFANVV